MSENQGYNGLASPFEYNVDIQSLEGRTVAVIHNVRSTRIFKARPTDDDIRTTVKQGVTAWYGSHVVLDFSQMKYIS
ncbi:MAG TPA: hypothetical protein VJI97_00790 [Candidatus Nanoarchaeia archaeon]|nr:hypothetical protein [Candidatus Nanoarchaeia archaeon]